MDTITSRQPLAYSALGECAREGGSVITRLMTDKLANPQMLSLAAGFTDNRVLPQELVQEAAEVLGGEGGHGHLQYGMNRGRPGLREAVTELLQTYPGERELDLSPDNVLITNGSQQGLYILVQMLCDPGDIVLVESPSYFVFLELLAGLGVKTVSLPTDPGGGIDRERLGAFFDDLLGSGELERVRLIYMMGAFANPSTRCVHESEKAALLDSLRRLDRPIPVVEDMAYRELYFDEPYPARSVLALPEWHDYPVVYAGTFTKPFATGLKVGFMVSRNEELLSTIAKIKGHQDFGTAHFNQAIIEHVLKTGAYAGHLNRSGTIIAGSGIYWRVP
jgi:2-aminoadipate transaminase